MKNFSRWIRNVWRDFDSSQPYSLPENDPPLIRQRLDRYTSQ